MIIPANVETLSTAALIANIDYYENLIAKKNLELNELNQHLKFWIDTKTAIDSRGCAGRRD